MTLKLKRDDDELYVKLTRGVHDPNAASVSRQPTLPGALSSEGTGSESALQLAGAHSAHVQQSQRSRARSGATFGSNATFSMTSMPSRLGT